MPLYLYKCDSCGKITAVKHGMMAAPIMICSDCNEKMRKSIETMPGVNWNGSPPHIGLNPVVKELNKTHARRVDEYAMKKEARGEHA